MPRVTVRPEYRWWIVTLVVVGVLLSISALAMSRPDVVWRDGTPSCPHCRAQVEPFSVRCKSCREEYEWTVASDEDSPLSPWSLSSAEADLVRQRVKDLGGVAAAAARIAPLLDIPAERAEEYLEQVGYGRCGWCGGTGLDLAVPPPKSEPCPACLGRGRCIACDGDRRIRIGDGAADRALVRYQASMRDIAPGLPLEVQRAEARRLTEEFLGRWHGTEQAARAWFWPQWRDRGGEGVPRVVERCRQRLDTVLQALQAP
jgi:hypothetical protein